MLTTSYKFSVMAVDAGTGETDLETSADMTVVAKTYARPGKKKELNFYQRRRHRSKSDLFCSSCSEAFGSGWAIHTYCIHTFIQQCINLRQSWTLYPWSTSCPMYHSYHVWKQCLRHWSIEQFPLVIC